MKHEQALELIEAQFEKGPLAPHQAEALRAHLRGCERCRSKYDRYADVERLLANDQLAPPVQVERLLALGVPERAPLRAASVVRRLAPVLAIAAGLLLAFVLIDRAPALPDYRLVTTGGARELRGSETSEVLRVDRGTRFELILRPEVPAEGAIEARAFVAGPEGTRAWPAKVESSSDGAIRIAAAGSDLPAGVDRILIAIGRPGALPSREEIARGDEGSWQLFVQRVVVLR